MPSTGSKTPRSTREKPRRRTESSRGTPTPARNGGRHGGNVRGSEALLSRLLRGVGSVSGALDLTGIGEIRGSEGAGCSYGLSRRAETVRGGWKMIQRGLAEDRSRGTSFSKVQRPLQHTLQDPWRVFRAFSCFYVETGNVSGSTAENQINHSSPPITSSPQNRFVLYCYGIAQAGRLAPVYVSCMPSRRENTMLVSNLEYLRPIQGRVIRTCSQCIAQSNTR